MTTAILRGKLLSSPERTRSRRRELDSTIFGKKFGIVSSLFGCRHGNLSRPFGQRDMTYRTCLDCGARTPFDLETLTTHGKFYRSPGVRSESVNCS
jgi:hypothetical protein